MKNYDLNEVKWSRFVRMLLGKSNFSDEWNTPVHGWEA